MILNFDASQLEWRAIAHLSGDKTGLEEINNGLDFHTDNQSKFKLPSRLIAKKFLFRNIYCPYLIADATAYAYSVDNDFKQVGNKKFWRGAIETFYEKYTGIANYHIRLIHEAQSTGRIISETGRIYNIEMVQRRGEWVWPYSDIANYPVQGFSADIMMLARVIARKRFKKLYPNALFINTVHDSIVLDVDERERTWYNICIDMKRVFGDLQNIYEQVYRKPLSVPMDCDAKAGINWLWQHKIKV